MSDRLPQFPGATRRAVLGSIGATVGGLALAGSSSASGGEPSVVLRQGDTCVPVPAFSGDQSVEAFYDYRLPGQYVSETNGAFPQGDGTPYSSEGTAALQRDGTSLLLLYDGPEGLSLVVVHGSLEAGPTGGGSVTLELEGLPADGSWAVRDDYYVDPETGAIAESNYDVWRVDDPVHVVDWTWADGRTDGGAFRGLGDEFSVTITPGFDEDAALFGQHYEGTVESWELLSPDGDGVKRVSLDQTTAVTLETGTCDGGDGHEVDDDERSVAPVETVEFKRCSEAWVVFERSFDGSVGVTVKTTAGQYEVEISGGHLQRVPGQFGDSPLFKWRVTGDEKVLAVETPDGWFENDHRCTQDEDDRDDDEDDEGDEEDDDRDDEDDEDDDDRDDEGDEEDDDRDDEDDEDDDDDRDDEGDEEDDDRDDEGDEEDDDRDDRGRGRGPEGDGEGGPGRGPPG